jgi:hypothetical protein
VGVLELKKELMTSTGTLYHHLEVMQELLTQDEKKKYYLTVIGKKAFNLLNQNAESMAITQQQQLTSQNKSWDEKIKHILLLKRLFIYALKAEENGFILTIPLVVLNAFLCSILHVEAYLFFYIPNTDFSENWGIGNSIIIFIAVLLGFGILFVCTEVLCRIIFEKKENWRGLLSVLGIPYLSMTFYLVLFAIFSYIPGFAQSFGNNIIMIISQIWAMFLLAYAVSQTKFVKFERGLIIGIFINYGTFIIVIIARNPFV